jgi:ferredoxin-NADP reductase
MSEEIMLDLTFEKRQNITDDIALFSFSVKPDNFVFKAGQYMNLGMPHEGKMLFRSFSIASLQGAHKTIDFLIPYRKDGLFSHYVYELSLGDTIKAKGPFGSMVLEKVDSETIFFFSTGTGIVPFRSMLVELRKILLLKKNIYFYTQQHTIASIPFLNEFIQLAQEFSNFFFKIFSDRYDDKIPEVYFIKSPLLEFVSRISFINTDIVFASGNPEFIKSLKNNLMLLEQRPSRIVTD